MHTVETIINAETILTVDAENTALSDHALIVDKGKIVDIVPRDTHHYQAATVIDKPHHTLIPGFVNAHTHAAMHIFKGFADDQPLHNWLYNYILPAEAQQVSEAFIEDGLEMAIAEMLKSGTTCFNDMYYFPNLTASLARKHHIRAAIGLIILEFETIWANDPGEYIRKGLKLYDDYAGSSHIKPVFAPHSPYAVSDDTLKEMLKYTEQLNTPIHMHIHETEQEIEDSIAQHGARPLARLDALGLLGPGLLAVHMVHLTEKEIQRVAETNTHIVHCPKSNLKLASGICPVAALEKAGVTIALGTDGAASNNTVDMLAELNIAALLAKGASGNASITNAETALRMATINGAKALGWDTHIGSLEAGKYADIVAIDTRDIACQPHHQTASQIVYSASKQQVSDVWVGGKAVVQDHNLLFMDEAELLARAKHWQHTLR